MALLIRSHESIRHLTLLCRRGLQTAAIYLRNVGDRFIRKHQQLLLRSLIQRRVHLVRLGRRHSATRHIERTRQLTDRKSASRTERRIGFATWHAPVPPPVDSAPENRQDHNQDHAPHQTALEKPTLASQVPLPGTRALRCLHGSSDLHYLSAASDRSAMGCEGLLNPGPLNSKNGRSLRVHPSPAQG